MSFGKVCKIGAIACGIIQAVLLVVLLAMAHHDYTEYTQQEEVK